MFVFVCFISTVFYGKHYKAQSSLVSGNSEQNGNNCSRWLRRRSEVFEERKLVQLAFDIFLIKFYELLVHLKMTTHIISGWNLQNKH